MFWVELKNNSIPSNYLHKGPPKNLESNVKEFKKKHKKVFLKKGVYYAEIKREITNATEFIKNLFTNDYIKERVKKIFLWN